MPPLHSSILHPDRRDAGEIVDPRRLRREHARWEGMDQATRFARVAAADLRGAVQEMMAKGA